MRSLCTNAIKHFNINIHAFILTENIVKQNSILNVSYSLDHNNVMMLQTERICIGLRTAEAYQLFMTIKPNYQSINQSITNLYSVVYRDGIRGKVLTTRCPTVIKRLRNTLMLANMLSSAAHMYEKSHLERFPTSE